MDVGRNEGNVSEGMLCSNDVAISTVSDGERAKTLRLGYQEIFFLEKKY